jgi:hypothetical protein
MNTQRVCIKSRSSKSLSIALLIVIGLITILTIVGKHYYFMVFELLGASYFAFQFHKEVCFNENSIVFHYPFRPFFRHREISVMKLRKFKFKPSNDGPEGWPYIRLFFSTFPFIYEFRITGMDDVFEIIKRLTVHGQFKVKSSDYRKKQLFKYLETNNIPHHLKRN